MKNCRHVFSKVKVTFANSWVVKIWREHNGKKKKEKKLSYVAASRDLVWCAFEYKNMTVVAGLKNNSFVI